MTLDDKVIKEILRTALTWRISGLKLILSRRESWKKRKETVVIVNSLTVGIVHVSTLTVNG